MTTNPTPSRAVSGAPQSSPTEPATTFAALGVPAPIVAALSRRGIDEPFPVQAMTLPDALAGRDLCGRAPTGSGKTLAFGIPLVARIRDARPGHPRALVLVPTRELATQVVGELRSLAGRDGAVTHAFFGGIGFGAQVSALRRGVDIAVACPGRLADLVQQGIFHLDEVQVVVLDEADRMADMGFLPEVRRLLDRTPSDRQTLLFSATLDGDVDVLTSRYQRNPVRHEVERDADDVDRSEHHFVAVERADRVATTARLVVAHGPTVVFTRTKHGADRVARQIGRTGLQAAVVHGNRSQGQRERALEAFHTGAAEVLVATDVAARGIHVDGVACVVHFDPPADPKDYVHRSGRTARAGSSGVVVTLVSPEDRKQVEVLQRSLGYATGTGGGPEAPTAPVRRPAGSARRQADGGDGAGRRDGRDDRRSRSGERTAGPGRPRRKPRPAGGASEARSARTTTGSGGGGRSRSGGAARRAGGAGRTGDARTGQGSGSARRSPAGAGSGRTQGRPAAGGGGRGAGSTTRSDGGSRSGPRRAGGGASSRRGAGRPR